MSIRPEVRSASWVADFLELRPSTIHGVGIFTSRLIEPGERVIEWGGTLFTTQEIKAGHARQYSYVPINEEWYLGSPANAELTVDDYINHSCAPNLWMLGSATLIARFQIPRNGELTADYAMWLADESYEMKNPCNCGTIACRHRVTGKDWRSEDLQLAYRGHFSTLVEGRIANSRLAQEN